MKSKQSIRILIALMSLALIGVTVIQFLWISNAVLLKQEQFDRSVKMAMIRVSADLESKYGVHLITEKLEKDSAARKQVMKQDPGFYKFMININDSEVEQEEVRAQSSVLVCGEEALDANMNMRSIHRNRQVIAMVNVNDNGQQEIATINVLGEEPEPIVSEAAFMLPAAPVAPPMPPSVPSAPGSKSNLMNIVQCVADEYAMSQMDAKDIYDVIDSAKIRASIGKEFKEAGLPSNFDFATYCTKGDTLMINKAASESPL
ncbi:MAG TPA: hypothetical protein VK174_14430, partial [Chitinophagales bacterium]|nr:hypothetical protein [Chitinophagales bacterium]